MVFSFTIVFSKNTWSLGKQKTMIMHKYIINGYGQSLFYEGFIGLGIAVGLWSCYVFRIEIDKV